MAKMRQFDIEISKRADKDSDPKVGDPFEIALPPFVEEYDDGEEYVVVEGREMVVQSPTLSRFMDLQVRYEMSSSPYELASALSAMIYSCLEPADQIYVRRRFNDPNDPLGVDTLATIFEKMVESWSARPTKKPSGSSSSRAKRGSTSTPKQPSQDETSSES